jgi:type II secretory pathway component PulC
VGTGSTVLLSRQGEQGLYRVGDTLEERIRIQRIEKNRVILVRDDEQATMEVLP